MSQPSNFTSEKIHILDARIISFGINNSLNEPLDSRDIRQMNFKVDVSPGFQAEAKLSRITLEVGIDAFGDEEKLLKEDIGKFVLHFLYKVDNLDDLLIEEEDITQVDQTLALHLAAISYSSARGLILAKVAGTCLSGAMLPIIDPGVLLANE